MAKQGGIFCLPSDFPTDENSKTDEFFPQFVNSVLSSLDDEDADDLIFGLPRKIENEWSISGSPNSTLCTNRNGNGVDLTYAAAVVGQLPKKKNIAQLTPSSVPLTKTTKPTRISRHQLQQQIEQQKQIMANGALRQKRIMYGQVLTVKASSSPVMAARPTFQQAQPVFVNQTGVKKERTGTGVFIPCPLAKTPNKPPVNVVHGSNLNLGSGPTGNHNFASHHGVALNSWSEKRNTKPRTNKPLMNQEHGLPQDWTY